MQVIGTSKLAHRQNLGAKPANRHNPVAVITLYLRYLHVFLPLPAQLSETVSCRESEARPVLPKAPLVLAKALKPRRV